MARSVPAAGRGLWPLVLTMTVALVVADFLRPPLHGPPDGVAAPRAGTVVVWVPGIEAGGPGQRLAATLAGRLDRPWRPARSRLVRGGSAAAVTTVLGRRPGGTPPLLLVDARTVADVERDAAGSALPAIAQEARAARRLLARAEPIAVLADDPLVVAATAEAGPPARSATGLVTAMRRDPGAAVFGIAPDAWSRTALAAFVHAAGVRGDVRYRVLPTADAAVLARAGDLADVVLAPRSALHRLPLARGLRPLAQSGASAAAAGRPRTARGPGPALPAQPAAAPTLASLLGRGAAVAGAQRWIALVAPPGTSARARRALRRQVARAAAGPRWRAALERLSLTPPPAGPPAVVLARERAAQTALARAAGHVAQRPPARAAAPPTQRRR